MSWSTSVLRVSLARPEIGLSPPVKYFTGLSKAVLLLWIFYVLFSVLFLLCFRVRLFICALWSPAWKILTYWLSFVVSNCEFVTFPLVSWVRCVTWLYRFLIFSPLLTLLSLVWKEYKIAIKEKSYLYIRTSQRTNSRWCTPRTIYITRYVNCATVEIITRFTSLSCSSTNFCISRNCQCDCSMVWGRRVSTVCNIYSNMRLSKKLWPTDILLTKSLLQTKTLITTKFQ